MADDLTRTAPSPDDATRSQPPDDATRTTGPTPDSTRSAAAGGGDTADDVDPTAFLTPPGRPDSLGRLGHYEVLEVLGRGGFGIVYRAFDEKLQRVVAVKVLAPQLAAAPIARQRFLREARSAAAVKHPNVVQVYAVEEQPLPHLVMEYVPGPTLQQRLDRDGPLPLPELLRVGRQVADGLAAAHATGLVHRDIKPSNVLLDTGPDPAARITDFGLARAADDTSLTRTGTVAGTPIYMSPEQARGEALDHRSDLFSLGSVLYALATGRPPFRAESTFAVLKRVTEDSPTPIRELRPELPDWFARIVGKLHAKDPVERFQSAGEVADLLADCERQLAEGDTLTDTSRIPAARRTLLGRWVAFAVAAGVLCALVAVGVAVWMSAGPAKKVADMTDKTPMSDADRLLGDWAVVSGERGGEVCTSQAGEETTIRFDQNEFRIFSSMVSDGNPDGFNLTAPRSEQKRLVLARGSYRVDTARKEVLLTQQTDRRKISIAVPYVFEGERLRLTFPDQVMGHLILTERLRKLKPLAGLAAALHEYRDEKGHFPPAGLPAPTGKDLKPLLSWRVAILPYLNEDALFGRFHLDEPWDSEHNKTLIPKMPKVFAVPGVEAPVGHTLYQSFSGQNTALEPGSAGRKGPTILAMTDGPSRTLLVVEAADPVVWTKPADLPFEYERFDRFNPKNPLPKLRFANGGVNVVFADGTAQTLPNSVAGVTLHDLITRAGGEVPEPQFMTNEGPQMVECVRTPPVLPNDPPSRPTMVKAEPTVATPRPTAPTTPGTPDGR